MDERSLAVEPPQGRRVAPVAGPADRTPAERALVAAEATATPAPPERMIVRLAMAEAQEATTTVVHVAANLEAVRDQLAHLRELVIAGRLEPRVRPEPATVALPDAVATLERTITALVAALPAAAPRATPAAAPAPLAPAPPPVVDAPVAWRPPTPEPVPVRHAPVPAPSLLLLPAGVPTTLVPTGVAPAPAAPAAATAPRPAGVPTTLAVGGDAGGLVPAGVPTTLEVGDGAGLLPAGVPTALEVGGPPTTLVPIGVASAALLVTHDPDVLVAPAADAPVSDGVPAVLQHRALEAPARRAAEPMPAPPASQALLVDLSAIADVPAPEALLVVDEAMAVVERAVEEVDRARQVATEAVEKTVRHALPQQPIATPDAAMALAEELRSSVPQQALASMAAAVAGFERRQVERLLVDVPAAQAEARRRSPRPVVAMSATATRT